MNWSNYTRIPGTSRAAIESINAGSAPLSVYVLRLTPLGFGLAQFLGRIRSLVPLARSGSIETAVSAAHLRTGGGRTAGLPRSSIGQFARLHLRTCRG